MIEDSPIKLTQIALPLSFDRQYSFDNFLAPQDGFIAENLKSLIETGSESIIGLWGGVDSGKTHLLNACALFARNHSSDFHLYDAVQLVDCDSSHFDEFDSQNIILAIDNLDAICGKRDWEEVFYRLINACRDKTMRLIFSLSQKPGDLSCELADLQSRLSWGLLLELPKPGEAEIENIVKLRARLLGIQLSSEVTRYLLTHYSRQLSRQIEILRMLDNASLSAQKKITIPLVKQVLASL